MSLPFRYRVRRFVIVLTVLLIALTLLTRWERRRVAGTATTAVRTPAEGAVDGESVLADAPIRAAAEGRGLQVVFGHDRPIYKAGRVGDWTHSSDHGPFHDAGVPFVYLGVEDHADYHQASDAADKIAPRFVAEVGALVVALLRHLDALAAQVPR